MEHRYAARNTFHSLNYDVRRTIGGFSGPRENMKMYLQIYGAFYE
jgi:hypothetical protein